MAAGGLSPRVRGKRKGVQHILEVRGSIPACAGEARCCGQARLTQQVYPRVCGGSPRGNADDHALRGLSPRVRGKPLAYPRRGR